MKNLFYFTTQLKITVSTIVILMINVFSTYAQSAWDIGYLSIDSINPSYIGKEIRIDFKSSHDDILPREINVRKLLAKRDTVTLNVKEKEVNFIESWKIYIDWGILKDQTLKEIGGDKIKEMQIREMYLQSMDESTLTLEIYIYTVYTDKDRESLKRQIIEIEKAKIKGILVRTDD